MDRAAPRAPVRGHPGALRRGVRPRGRADRGDRVRRGPRPSLSERRRRTISAVLFDVDGTLVDHDGAAEAALLGQLGQRLPGLSGDERAELRSEWHRLEEHHYERYLGGVTSFAEQRRRRARALLELIGEGSVTDEEADAWIAGYAERYEAAWTAFEDARPAIDALLAARPAPALGAITNGEADFQRAKLAAVRLERPLQAAIVASSEVGVAKPDPAIFHAACERIGLEPAEVAYVGDRLETDALGARDAGLVGVWLDRSRSGSAPDGIPTIADLRELPPLLGLGAS